MARRPPTPVAVGDGQPGDGGGQTEPVGCPQSGGFRSDLADAVGAQEGPDPVVVAERVALGEDVVTHGPVDPGGGAVQECRGGLVVLHQVGEPTAVGPQILLPLI